MGSQRVGHDCATNTSSMLSSGHTSSEMSWEVSPSGGVGVYLSLLFVQGEPRDLRPGTHI